MFYTPSRASTVQVANSYISCHFKLRLTVSGELQKGWVALAWKVGKRLFKKLKSQAGKQADENSSLVIFKLLYLATCKYFLAFNAVLDTGWTNIIL